MGVHVCWCVSRGSGGSSVQHVPGKFCHHLRERVEERGRRAMRRKGRGETDGGISGEGRPIKREGERGSMRDRGIFGWDIQSGEEELKLSRGRM